MITTWSFSRWSTYDKCPRKAKFLYVDKLKEPESAAMLRGTRIHKAAEDFINGTTEIVAPELTGFDSTLRDLRTKQAKCELEWAFTANWEPTGWFAKDCWLRVKTDVLDLELPRLNILDWKTGRMYPEHRKQLGLYALGGFIMFPEVTSITASDYYLDARETMTEDYERDEVEAIKEVWVGRVAPMMQDEEFCAKPGRHCQWCHFSKEKGGPCDAS